jgi:DNA replication protein
MNEVVFKTLKQKDFIVKSFVLKVAAELDLTLADTILLIYLSNQEIPVLDIENIKETTYLTEEKILESFGKLTSMNLIQVNVGKNKDGKIEEIISLDNLIQSVTQDITTGIKKKTTVDLFSLIEEEFGRTLSSMEYEIINNWVKTFDPEMIKEALREAVYNNAKSLKYIESILYAWKDKGYKSIDDIHKGYVEYANKSESKDLYDFNWLDDED